MHPADIGSVLVALPRNSRDTVLRVMSPDTATWILRQMNPVQAGHFVARVGVQDDCGNLERILNQVHPMTATYALRRFSPWQAWRVARTLDHPPEAPEIVVHAPDTARIPQGH